MGGLAPGPRGAVQALGPLGEAQGLNEWEPVPSEGLGPGFMRAFLRLGSQEPGWIWVFRAKSGSGAAWEPGSMGTGLEAVSGWAGDLGPWGGQPGAGLVQSLGHW